MPLKLHSHLPLTAPAKSTTPPNTNSSTNHHPATRALIPDEQNHLRSNFTPQATINPKTSSNSSSPLTRRIQHKLLRGRLRIRVNRK
ncbi:hypothetical protein SADUNF_Sadunf17G0123400 [Salix dunnii]|uniref:Uncharacterized protein n=1 Tax=Salix dunnii TaxID=1413687 RepID=A0A835J6V7_9ROSI|nr:hypothetical protein SADUNF_Sadunf17G0123400 [Salix dunnii]